MTEKLYLKDGHCMCRSAVVTGCEPCDGGFAVLLDATPFFPGGGGQSCDGGTLDGACVSRCFEDGDDVVHVCEKSFAVGAAVTACVDEKTRFRRMQLHSGEHIVSGVAHGKWGCENVGFHMDDSAAVIDFDRELTADQLAELERCANRAIWENRPFRISFPSPEELPRLDYRSKLELTENVRLVEIEGVDLCACCAPHVAASGEVGAIKIVDRLRHRGGIRLTIVCGQSAYEDYCRKHANVSAISALLSAKPDETASYVERLLAERDSLAGAFHAYQLRVAEASLPQFVPCGCTLCLVTDLFDADMMRFAVNVKKEEAPLAAVFSGDSTDGYRYLAAGKITDTKSFAARLNAALNGRGGGRDGMIQGSAQTTPDAIRAFFEALKETDL